MYTSKVLSIEKSKIFSTIRKTVQIFKNEKPQDSRTSVR